MEITTKAWSESLVLLSGHTLNHAILKNIVSQCYQQDRVMSKKAKKELVKICCTLLQFLADGKLSMDQQLMASTAFCAAIQTSLQECIVNNLFLLCLSKSDTGNFLKISLGQERQELLIHSKETFRLVLCHGLLQHSSETILNNKTPNIYEAVFYVLEDLCKTHSSLTYVAFKLLAAWLKKINEPIQGYCLDILKAKVIFSVINNNWESPFSGVRKQNIRILENFTEYAERSQLLKSFTVSYLLPTVLHEQSWKLKNKYYMLTALLPKYGVLQALSDFPKLAPGLVSSVQHSHLVTAGCDTYKVCLRQLHQEDEWQQAFLDSFIRIFWEDAGSSVAKENLLKYWVPPTLKKFPVLLKDLLLCLSSKMDGNFESPLFLPVISLVNFGRKEGFIINFWDGEWMANQSRKSCTELLCSALQHSSETIRSHAFSAVCTCSKTSILPSMQEFETVKQFLSQNVNADSSPLRQNILASFKTFLVGLRDACFHVLKMNKKNAKLTGFHRSKQESLADLTNMLEFLDWLYHFLLLNLEPGTNYQRKITSLSIYREVLNCLGSNRNSPVEENQDSKIEKTKDWNIKEYATRNGKWLFDSEVSRKYILACVMDPTDDIRELAGSISIEHFTLDTEVHEEESEFLLKKALHLCGSPLFYETESGALLIKVISSFPNMSSKEESNNTKVKQLMARVAHNCNFAPGTFEGISVTYIDSTEMKISQESNLFEGLLVKLSSSDNEEQEKGRNNTRNISFSSDYPTSVNVSSVPQQKHDYRQDKLLLALCSKTRSYSASCCKSRLDDCKKQMPSHFDFRTTDPNKASVPREIQPAKCDIKHVPGTYEGLVVMDPHYVELKNNFKISSDLRTFEGLTVINPTDGEIGQHVNYVKENKSTSAIRSENRYSRVHKYHTTDSEFLSVGNNHRSSSNRKDTLTDIEGDCLPPVNSSRTSPSVSKQKDDILQARDVGCHHEIISSPTNLMGLLVIKAQAQWQTLQRDLYRAASSGSPLHGLLTAFTHLVSQSCTSDSSLNLLMTSEEAHNVVSLMENVVEHLLAVLASKSTSFSAFAPSFAEMSEAIESVIQWSAPEADDQDMQVSPAHQLVLNCIWLNLKACCSLSSLLAQARDTSGNMAVRCVQLIVQVLTRCRHKGAIESAGMALASFVRHATSKAEGRLKVKDLPKQLLLHFLDLFADGGVIAMSTTRRSAGLAILIHRIVASDVQPKNPLLNICMDKLMTAAGHESATTMGSKAAQCDLPEAQALHFLCTLMKDSGLRQSMAPYISDITILCFSKFSSSMWAIRNAALQLFGALVPKLVGEKKVQDDEIKVYGNITIEEFFSHYPKLVQLLLTTLNTTVGQPSLQHSQLVPMLSLLSKLCIGAFSLMEDSLKEDVQKFKFYFSILISSDIYAVRKLSAKAYTRFHPLDKIKLLVYEIKTMILGNPILKENVLHGNLLVMKYCRERLMDGGNDVSYSWVEMTEDLRYLHEVPYIHEMSWLIKALVAEVSGKGLVHSVEKHCTTPPGLIRRVFLTLMVESSQKKVNPGIFHWAKVEINLIFEKCPQEYLYEAWLCVYSNNWDELCVCCLHILQQRFSQDIDIKSGTRSSIFHMLLVTAVGMKWGRSLDLLFHIFDTLLTFVLDSHVSDIVTDIVTLQFILYQNVNVQENGSHCASIALPLVCALYSVQIDESEPDETHLLFVRELVDTIVERSASEVGDENCRLYAAQAFHLILPTILKLSQNGTFNLHGIGEEIIDAGLAFLQDEDSEVRKEAAKFLAKLSVCGHVSSVYGLINPYVCLEKLLNPIFLQKILSVDDVLIYLCKKLINIENSTQQVLKHCRRSQTDVQCTSPFDHGTSNVYAEEINIANLITTSLLLKLMDANASLRKHLVHLINVSCSKEDVNEVLQLSTSNNSDSMNSSVKDALHLIKKKYMYLSKVKRALLERQSGNPSANKSADSLHLHNIL